MTTRFSVDRARMAMDDQQRAANGQFGSGGGAAKKINREVKKADPVGAAASKAYKEKYAGEIKKEEAHGEKMAVRASKERLHNAQQNFLHHDAADVDGIKAGVAGLCDALRMF